jgi:hypothetical protein
MRDRVKENKYIIYSSNLLAAPTVWSDGTQKLRVGIQFYKYMVSLDGRCPDIVSCCVNLPDGCLDIEGVKVEI